jgi:hypothetical protein
MHDDEVMFVRKRGAIDIDLTLPDGGAAVASSEDNTPSGA